MPNKSDLIEFRLYCKIGKLFGIVPLKRTNLSIIYSLTLILFVFMWVLVSCFARRDMYMISFKTVIILDLLSSIFCLLFLITSIGSSIWNKRLWQKLITLFYVEDVKCKIKLLPYYKLTICTILYLILTTSLICTVTESHIIQNIYFTYLIYSFHSVYELFMLLLISIVLIMVIDHRRETNKSIQRYFDNTDKKVSHQTIQLVTRRIRENEDMVETANNLFGWPMFFFFGNALSNILQCMNMTLDRVAVPYGGLNTFGIVMFYINTLYYLVSYTFIYISKLN